MGLLDGVAGAVVGKMLGGQDSAIAKIAMDLLQQNGGLSGILAKFNDAGLADQAASWVGTGSNKAVSAGNITQVLGSDQLAGLASKLGVPSDILAGQVAEHLPDVINKMTPDGALPSNENDMLSQVLGMLK